MEENAAKQAGILEKLDEWGVAYELEHHAPAFTMEDMVAFGMTEKGLVAKNLFLRDAKGKRHFLVVVAGDKRVDLRALGERLGQRLSFASEERLLKQLNLTPGAVTPLGVLAGGENGLEVWLDEDLQGRRRIGVHPGVNTATVFLDCAGLLAVIDKAGVARAFVRL